MLPPTTPGALMVGTWVGSTPSPNLSWASATEESKSAWPASSLVSAMIRGRLAALHSSHNACAAPSMPSAAEITKIAASAARMPARNSPTKSGWPGASSRFTSVEPVTIEAR